MTRVHLERLPQPRAATQPLNRLEPNWNMSGVSGYWLVPASTIPEACQLARHLSRLFPEASLDEQTRVEVTFLQSEAHLLTQARSPSGEVKRYPGYGLWLDVDRHQRHCSLYLLSHFRVEGPLQRAHPGWKRVAVQAEAPLGPLLAPKVRAFVGGLISLSAEPPEGFFAASTGTELAQAGYASTCAHEADLWLYRVPDARKQSYFEFIHPTPDRPQDGPRAHKFLIASGIGPASEPDSPGGHEADLLWLGDEQHGPLVEYLRTLQRPDLRLSHLRQHSGLAQRLPDGRVLLAQVDRCWALSKDGFNQLATDPDLYRRIYDRNYDQYLRSLFRPTEPQPSFLLATSRGCTQGCAICCSGGLKAFQSFSASRMLEELDKIAARIPQGGIDLFFLDSNFNNHPGRIIEFADLYEASPHAGRFRFFVRHNTVNGFLQGGPQRKTPNLALIDAFRRLGIDEIFMGVDTFDDHSTLTLKSNRLHLARKGSSTRPTYTVAELRDLMEALDASGAYIKAFYLKNNPWVSDLDRLDSYYNIAELWLRFPRFSIDARHPEVNRLKPFAGSPIERVSRTQPEVLNGSRFVAPGIFGELDESIDLSVFGTPRSEANTELSLASFAHDLARVRRAAEQRFQSLGCADSRRILAKIVARDGQLLEWLPEGPWQAPIWAFAERWSHLPEVSPSEQRHFFERAASCLFEGLQRAQPTSRVPRLPKNPVANFPPLVTKVYSNGYRAAVPCRSIPRAMCQSS